MASISIYKIFCIFGLPLAFLFVLKSLKKPHKKYLVGYYLFCYMSFFASWYQMVFVFGCPLFATGRFITLPLNKWPASSRGGISDLLAALRPCR